jgi:hypothetical protein
LGIAEFIVPTGSFFHAQTQVSFHIIEELSPNVRMIPRDAQRDVHLAEAPSQATLTLSPFSSQRSVIPLPYENRRAMKAHSHFW